MVDIFTSPSAAAYRLFLALPLHGKRVGIYINTKLSENLMMTDRLVKWR
jgi:hypothetical protein